MWEPRATSPWSSIRLALLLCAFVIALVVSILVIVSPVSYTYRPRILARTYNNAPLAYVIADLEKANVIPKGTKWQHESLKRKRLTARWLWPSDVEALEIVGDAASVSFRYQSGYHGEVWAPITVEERGVSALLPVRWRGEYRGVEIP